jgi:hypothetical protein
MQVGIKNSSLEENIMSSPLPKAIASYIEAYNSRDEKAVLGCFSDDALVHDEGKDHRGRKAIGAWLHETIEKYQPLLTPGPAKGGDAETVVSVTVSGNFPGSPVTLAFHFMMDQDRISELKVVA